MSSALSTLLSRATTLALNPDALTLYVGLVLFFILFAIYEFRTLWREVKADRAEERARESAASHTKAL